MHVVDISAKGMKQDEPEYEAQNAMRQVPTLIIEEDGTSYALGQSLAIIEYLEEAHPEPALFPKTPLMRARAREVAEMVNAGIQPLQNVRVLERVHAQGSDERAWATDVIGRGLAAVERTIASAAGAFCFGETLSVADLFVYPQIINAERFSMPLSEWPNLARIADSCRAHSAFISTHPDLGDA